MGVTDQEITYVRENFEKKYADKISSGTYDDRDLRRLRTDDVYVTTFIRGPNRLDEGVDLVHESLRFRKEYGVNDLSDNSFQPWMWEKHALFYHGQTKTGHKIVFVRVKEHKKDSSQLLLVKKFFVYWLEKSFRVNPLEKIVTMFDMTEAGLSNLDMEFIRFMLTCFKLYYPTFLAAWKVIKTWLSQEAISLIKFVTKSDVHTYIDREYLFEHMGGTCSLDSVDYHPVETDDGAFSDTNDRRRVTFSESTDSHSSKHSLNLNNNAATRLTSPRAGRHNSNSSASDGSSFAGRLLTISPAEELTFVMDENSKEAYDVITLSNTLMYPIAFKVKTTAPEKYRVRPSTGIVKPGEAFEVYVYLQPGYITTVERDKFLVMAMEVTGDSYDTSLWKTAPKDTIMEHRMRCVAPNHVDYNVNVAVEGEKSGGGGLTATASNVASQAKSLLTSSFQSQMDMLIESNKQLRRWMFYLIVSHIIFFILTIIFFAAYFCLGEDLFSSYFYFPFGYCVSSSWNRRC